MSLPVSTSTATPRDTGEPLPGQNRRQQVLIVACVALAIILAAFWIARSQGMSSLGDGGVNSSLLPKVGEPAPEFMSLYASGDNEVFRLSDHEGQAVWLNFWGSWCPPCRAEMPEIQAAYEQLQSSNSGIAMLGISQRENPNESIAYAQRVGATFPIVVDPNFLASVADPSAFPDLFSTAATWQVRNFPTHVFIDKDGIVRAVVLRQMDTSCAIQYSELAMGTRGTNPHCEGELQSDSGNWWWPF